ncbi:MAG: diguanylate cyclase [Candidatus Lernaella stagnicola]|nr:diguanylate cyclase [Candidatus Lernaella stagnicola]
MAGKPEDQAALETQLEELRRENYKLDQELFNLTSLLQANKAFDNVLEAREVYVIYTSIVHERFGLKSYALFVMSEDRTAFNMERGFGLPDSLPVDFSFPWHEGLLWQAILQGQPFSVVDNRGKPRFRVPFEQHRLNELDAKYFLPLVHGGEVVGFLAVGKKEDGTTLSDNDIEFLATLSSHAAVSMKTTMLYEKNQQDKTELDKMVKNLSMLYDIGAAMIHISDLKKLLKFILGEAINTTASQKGSLMLYDTATQRLMVRVVKGLPDKRDEEAINNGERECTSFAVGEGIAGRVFETKKAIIVNSADKDDRYESHEQSNVVSILCLPLVAADEPIGVINITNKKDGKPFTPEDLELLTAMANQAAVAINNATLYEMAITDELTKIYIRRFFNIRLAAELKRAERYGKRVSVAICDLDKFKSVNDTYGHDVGDSTLIKIADVLRTRVREVDTPARFGGEEFSVVFPETGVEGASAVAERVREAVAEAEVPGLPRKVTISIGIASFPDHASDSAGLIRAADIALYKAKHGGRNRVCIYEPSDADEREARTENEGETD